MFQGKGRKEPHILNCQPHATFLIQLSKLGLVADYLQCWILSSIYLLKKPMWPQWVMKFYLKCENKIIHTFINQKKKMKGVLFMSVMGFSSHVCSW